jgi:DNA-binding NtrC family response regulator
MARNVRELENLVERAVVLGSSDRILPEDLSESVLEAGQDPVSLPAARYHDALNEAKKALILGAFETTGGDHAAAARLLGLHPNYLHRLVRNLQLKARIRR